MVSGRHVPSGVVATSAAAVAASAAAGTLALRRRGRRASLRTLTKTRRPGAAERFAADPLLSAPTIAPDILEIATPDGATLHVQAFGDPDAPPLVLSHGWTCRAEFWTPQINDLVDRYRVVTYDQRGHGRSTAGTRVFDPDVLGDDLAAVLAATVDPANRAVVAGHSMGGMSVMAWAGRHPEQVESLASGALLASTGMDALVASTTLVRLPKRMRNGVPLPVAQRVMGATVPLVASPLTTRAIKYVAMAPASTPAEVAFCEEIVMTSEPRARGAWGLALSTLDLHTALDRLTVPTTIVVGTRDRLTPPVHAHKLAEVLRRNGSFERLVELDGVGHMSSVEAITAFDAELVHLLERRTAGV